jgi:hypothetical protein
MASPSALKSPFLGRPTTGGPCGRALGERPPPNPLEEATAPSRTPLWNPTGFKRWGRD